MKPEEMLSHYVQGKKCLRETPATTYCRPVGIKAFGPTQLVLFHMLIGVLRICLHYMQTSPLCIRARICD